MSQVSALDDGCAHHRALHGDIEQASNGQVALQPVVSQVEHFQAGQWQEHGLRQRSVDNIQHSAVRQRVGAQVSEQADTHSSESASLAAPHIPAGKALTSS